MDGIGMRWGTGRSRTGFATAVSVLATAFAVLAVGLAYAVPLVLRFESRIERAARREAILREWQGPYRAEPPDHREMCAEDLRLRADGLLRFAVHSGCGTCDPSSMHRDLDPTWAVGELDDEGALVTAGPGPASGRFAERAWPVRWGSRRWLVRERDRDRFLATLRGGVVPGSMDRIPTSLDRPDAISADTLELPPAWGADASCHPVFARVVGDVGSPTHRQSVRIDAGRVEGLVLGQELRVLPCEEEPWDDSRTRQARPGLEQRLARSPLMVVTQLDEHAADLSRPEQASLTEVGPNVRIQPGRVATTIVHADPWHPGVGRALRELAPGQLWVPVPVGYSEGVRSARSPFEFFAAGPEAERAAGRILAWAWGRWRDDPDLAPAVEKAVTTWNAQWGRELLLDPSADTESILRALSDWSASRARAWRDELDARRDGELERMGAWWP